MLRNLYRDLKGPWLEIYPDFPNEHGCSLNHIIEVNYWFKLPESYGVDCTKLKQVADLALNEQPETLYITTTFGIPKEVYQREKEVFESIASGKYFVKFACLNCYDATLQVKGDDLWPLRKRRRN